MSLPRAAKNVPRAARATQERPKMIINMIMTMQATTTRLMRIMSMMSKNDDNDGDNEHEDEDL